MQTRRRHAEISKEILDLRNCLKIFDRSLRRLTPLLSAGVALNGASKENSRSRPRLSTKARASMVLQGRYLGYMRQLKPRQKAKVRKIKGAKGVRVAIVKAKALATGH